MVWGGGLIGDVGSLMREAQMGQTRDIVMLNAQTLPFINIT